MVATSLPIVLVSVLAFCGVSLMTDRKRGASVAQIGTFVAAVILIGSLSLTGPLWGIAPMTYSALGVSLFAATLAGMFYHLYLGRFTSVWKARGVFSLIYLGFAAVLGIVLLPLI